MSAGAGPTTSVYACTGAGGADEVACQDNEMGYMFYYNLDGNLGEDKTGTQTAVGGEELIDIQRIYWSGTEFDSSDAWAFGFFVGGNGLGTKNVSIVFAWPVRPGDVAAAVPEPATLALLGIGLAGLAFRRRKRV